MVTLVMMLVITLVVIGFAQIARRNQREALDNQLSTQAFYAAETGVNLVSSLMQTQPDVNSLKKTACPAQAPPYNAQLNDTVTAVANSCLLVDTAPSSLVYDDIGTDSTVVPVRSSTGTGSGTLELTWSPQSAQTDDKLSNCPNLSSYGTFPASSNWSAHCPFGVLRFDMVDVSAAGSLTAENLEGQTITVFAPPTSSHNALVRQEGTFSPGLSAVTCSGEGPAASCSLTIQNVNFSHTYYLRVTSLYKHVRLHVTGTAGGNEVHFINAQILVDSTGKAVDVLRRVQVRLDQNSQMAPANAIQAQSGICKLYTSTGSGTTDLTGCP